MKHMKKFFALLIAAMLVLAIAAPAMAATGEVSSDTTLTINNLVAGDQVKLYKVMEWVEGTGWRTTTAFKNLVTSDNAAFTQSIKDIEDNKAATLNEADVKNIESLITTSTTAADTVDSLDGTTYTYGTAASHAAPGLYIAIVASKNAGVLYNPMVLASDYSTTDNTNTLDAASANLTRTVASSTINVPKKETLDVNKRADDTTHDTGDTVTFTITTTVPLYSTSYTNPWFKVTDTLSSGLSLNADSITVYKTADSNKTNLINETTVKKNTTNIGDADFQIEFTTTYLTAMTAAEPITITYTATFTNAGGTNVAAEDNTVDVTYSNNPNDETSYGTVRDETRHYTFTIDGTLFGETTYEATEVVKVGIDSDGNEITQTTKLDNGNFVGALQGAKFALFTASPATTDLASEDAAKASSTIYKNTNYQDGCIVSSGEDGRITIAGLDADNNNGAGTTYYLAEIEAPKGYIKDSTVYPVTIIPVFEDKTYTDTTDSTITWTVSELKSYTVKINNVETASYTFKNSSDADTNFTGASGEKVVKGDTVVGKTGGIRKADADGATTDADKKQDSDAYGKIQNTQGVELPATGGAGTKVLITLGSLFAVAFAVVLVSRRRAEER